MMFHKRERRYKVLRMPPESILAAFHGWKHAAYLQLPTLPNLPPGTEVVGVNADWFSKSILFMLWSPEWPEVPDGAEPPRLDDPMAAEVACVRLDRVASDEPVYAMPAGVG